MSSSTKLYSPPTSPSSITNIALSCKTFRVFGLHTPAWQNAAASASNNRENEEENEIELISNAIITALSNDAGGYGTAGFHVHKVEQVEQHENTAVYNAKLIPCDGKTNEPINPQSIYTLTDNESNEIQYMGNDKFYLSNNASNNKEEKFQIRITVSKASIGLAAKRYYDALYTKRHELDIDELLDDVDSWVENDEELRELRQQLIDATNDNNVGTEEKLPMGYYIEMLLLEPHIKSSDVVIAPPVELDKSNPKRSNSSSGSSSSASLSREEENNLSLSSSTSIFTRDIYTSSSTLTNPTIGIYEKLNIKVFTNIGLDVRKSLVRIEFPSFSEGCQDKTFREVYQLNARLKSGSFATVCRGTHRATGKKVAIKCVLRKDLPPGDDAAIYDEVLILSTLQHSYICPLIDFFEERECYFLIMELMSGGDLFDRIGAKKCYTENDARSLCRKMLESVRYCHENSVAHCDMKPKNLLLVSDDDDVSIKLADFGFATRVYEPKSLTKQCGTPFFVAPEVLMRSPYDQQSDMWSVGVIMFLLLAGDLPFMGRTQKDLFRNIVMGKYEFEEDSWAHVSDQAKELVRQLLVTDPSQRLSSRKALNSSWMRERGSMLAMNKLQYTSNRLAGFNARMKLRGSMLAVTSVARMRMSARSMVESGRSLENKSSTSVVPSKRSSFLDELPVEGENEEDN